MTAMTAGYMPYDTPIELAALDTPCVLIDEATLDSNLRRVADRAAQHDVTLRPHSKTHKSAWIAHRQIELGSAGVTVAKVSEGEALVAAGIPDVFVAYPIVTPIKLQRLFDLAENATVSTLVEDLDGARCLSKTATERGTTIGVWVDVDTGLDRIGATIGPSLAELVTSVRDLRGVELLGLSTHEGHVYKVADPEERKQLALEWLGALLEAAPSLGVERVSTGATPTMLDVLGLDGLTDARPGNYAFYDAMQLSLGTVELDRCALSMLVTCVSHRAPTKAMIDAGSKSFSSDTGAHGTSLMTGYGIVKGRPDLGITGLSEEHGWLSIAADGDGVAVGDQLEVVPNHACSTIANFEHAHLVRDGLAVARIAVTTRGCFT
jgi:D-serine deaminase-like pyridoxal phosphate-dependent protein